MKTARDIGKPRQESAVTTAAFHDVLTRIRSEYDEMPGMCVTRAQAQRLWGLDSTTCELVLTALLERHVLRQTRRGMFVKW